MAGSGSWTCSCGEILWENCHLLELSEGGDVMRMLDSRSGVGDKIKGKPNGLWHKLLVYVLSYEVVNAKCSE